MINEQYTKNLSIILFLSNFIAIPASLFAAFIWFLTPIAGQKPHYYGLILCAISATAIIYPLLCLWCYRRGRDLLQHSKKVKGCLVALLPTIYPIAALLFLAGFCICVFIYQHTGKPIF